MLTDLITYTPTSSLFEDFFYDDWPWSHRRVSNELKLDVNETCDKYIITADAPGATKDNLSVEFDNDILTITYGENINREENTGNYRLKERRIGKFSRSLRVPMIDEDSINASLQNGVLTITIQKIKEQDTRKRIEVKQID